MRRFWLRRCAVDTLESRRLLTVSLVPRALVEIQADDPRTVLAADMDADGDQDLVVASASDGRVAWYANLDGEGTFGAAQVLIDDARGASSLFHTDLDGDGQADLLVASTADDHVRWFANLGQGTFSAPRVISADVNGASSVVAADLDGDGDADVVTAASADDEVTWFENLGQGVFAPARLVAAEVDSVRSVFAGDLDGDGDSDLVAAASGSDTVFWYENLEGGSFSAPQEISANLDRVNQVWLADVDADDDLDVVASAPGDDQIVWLENEQGDARQFVQQLVADELDRVAGIFVGDLDADGDVDVVSAAGNLDQIAWHENTGRGRFVVPELLSTNAKDAVAVTAADFNGDGRADVVSASRADNKIAWYPQSEFTGIFEDERQITNAAEGAFHVAVADVDGDGLEDLLSAFEDNLAWYRNSEVPGEFSAKLDISSEVPGASWVDAADIDLDGDLDVVATSSFDGAIYWFENIDGLGNFGLRQTIVRGSANWAHVVLADIDQDQDVDVLATSGVGRVTVYENFNLGLFALRGVAPWSLGSKVIATGDMEGTGNVDMLTSDAGGILWHPNLDGSGAFQSFPRPVSRDVTNATSLFVADVDADGDLDVISAAPQLTLIAWHENLGLGVFAAEPHIVASGDPGIDAVYAADVDGDGSLDIVAAASSEDDLMWFANEDGEGTFGPRQDISLDANNARSLQLADVDADGDLDLFSASWLAAINGEIVWYENRLTADIDNDGQVGFSDFLVLSQNFGRSQVTLAEGDLDNDGQVSFADFLLLSANFGVQRAAADHVFAAARGPW